MPKTSMAIAVSITAVIVAAVVVQLTTPTKQSKHSGLKAFSSSDKSFTVMLPDGVKEDKQIVETQLGPVAFVSFSAKNAFQDFSIAYSDYPDEYINSTAPDAVLDGSRDGAIYNIQGTLLSESKIDMNGYSGRELKIGTPQQMILKSRIYLVKNRLYQIMAVSKPDHADDKLIDDVFGSFKINRF